MLTKSGRVAGRAFTRADAVPLSSSSGSEDEGAAAVRAPRIKLRWAEQALMSLRCYHHAVRCYAQASVPLAGCHCILKQNLPGVHLSMSKVIRISLVSLQLAVAACGLSP